MQMPSSTPFSRRRFVAGASALALLTACGARAAATTTTSSTGAADTTTTAVTTTSGTTGAATPGTGLFDPSTVHTIAADYDQTEYQAMIDAFTSDGTKNWITATVTIDGTAFADVGIKLKGNSTLRGLGGGGGGGMGGTLSADKPEGLPWRIRLDKYVDGQNFGGQTDLVIRGGNTVTGLNEAVALTLIGDAGLATEKAASTRFSANGGTQALRLVIQNPSEEWYSENFDSAGILYKAEADGDYSYRGDDAAAYADVFSVEASTSGEDDYAPLTAFLQFLNDSDDATFAADLAQHLDVDAFATYLAVQTLVDNSDDIDGPGNNSYLRCDTVTGVFTVVAWDQNLSFGGMGGGMGGGGNAAGGNAAGGMQRPANAQNGAAAGGGGGGGARGGNILAERFQADTEFAAKYTAALSRLTADLYTSGTAQTVLDSWTGVLTSQAGDLVTTATVDSEAAKIAAYFTAS